MSERLTLDIQSVAAGGDGVARHEGMVVFVPRTAAGDRIIADVVRQKRMARGRLTEVLAPSPDRVDPPCPHYTEDDCGGCQLQHVRYPAQLAIKAGIVRDTLTRLGGRAVDAPEVVPSAHEWRYRAKLTLAMVRDGAHWVSGLHPYDDPAGVFQLDDCPITDERVVAAWREIFAAEAHYPDATQLRTSVRLMDRGVAIVVEGGALWRNPDAFLAAVPSALAVWWKPADARRRLVASRGESADGASFVQVNPDVAAKLRAHVIERARAHSPRTLVDAYAGSGATARALAGPGTRVTAIEVDADAVAVAGRGLPAGSRAIAGRVEELLPRALPADVAIVNPPRGGLHERVAATLDNARSLRAVIYVSCDPATLARDLKRMPRYRIASLRSFDMFPQTAHVETVCELVPEAA